MTRLSSKWVFLVVMGLLFALVALSGCTGNADFEGWNPETFSYPDYGTPGPTLPPPVPIEVSIDDLKAEFAADPYAAHDKYRGKMLQVIGVETAKHVVWGYPGYTVIDDFIDYGWVVTKLSDHRVDQVGDIVMVRGFYRDFLDGHIQLAPAGPVFLIEAIGPEVQDYPDINTITGVVEG